MMKKVTMREIKQCYLWLDNSKDIVTTVASVDTKGPTVVAMSQGKQMVKMVKMDEMERTSKADKTEDISGVVEEDLAVVEDMEVASMAIATSVVNTDTGLLQIVTIVRVMSQQMLQKTERKLL